MRQTLLAFDEAATRLVINDGTRRKLRYTDTRREAVFTLERDDAFLTGPPRVVRKDNRYLYVGGRRRPTPEPWMLQ